MVTDAIVIGGGPAGYVAASRLSQEGLKVCLIERKYLGGECTNWGCIPSKTLIEAAHAVSLAKAARQAGIKLKLEELNTSRLMRWVRRVRDRARAAVTQLLSEVEIVEGVGRVKSPHVVSVKLKDGGVKEIEGRYIVVATGSDPSPVPGFAFDGRYVLSNRDFFELESLPDSILIIGAGAIGTEIAAALARLGVKVHLAEILDCVLPSYGPRVGELVAKYLRRYGVRIHVSVVAKPLEVGGNGVRVKLLPRRGGDADEVVVDKVLIAAGRRYLTKGIGLEDVGVELGDKGVVIVNEDLRTSVPTILAAGDVTGPPLLAHKAYREGMIAAETIVRGSSSIPRGPVPAVIFTTPEVASVGITEEQARRLGLDVRVVRYGYAALSRDYTVLERTPDGFAEVVLEKRSNRVLGALVVGNGAAELIHVLGLAVAARISIEEVAKSICSHPTYSEIVCELAHKALGRPVHGALH